MSTAAAPARPFAGAGPLLRIALRGERIAAPVTVVLFVAMQLSTGAAIESAYGSLADRAQLAAGMGLNKAFLLLLGPLDAIDPVAAVVHWRAGLFMMVALGALAVMTVVRHTRKEEESGRLELVRSTRVGVLAPLWAGFVVAALLSLVTALAMAATLLPYGVGAAQTAAVFGQYAAVGLLGAALGALGAQISATSRGANLVAVVPLIGGYLVRGIADLGHSLSWLAWLSPIGWAQRVDPFTTARWWPLVLIVVLAALACGAGALLAVRRDLGAGVFVPRRGPARAAGLRSPLAIQLRVQRAGWAGWTGAIALYCLLIGVMLNSIGDLVGDTEAMTNLLENLGGTGVLIDSVQVMIGSMVGYALAAWSITLVTGARTDETTGRLEVVLATATSRARYLGSVVATAVLGTVGALAIAGAVLGIGHGLTGGAFGPSVGDGLAAMLVQAPASLTVTAAALVLWAWAPRRTVAAWALVLFAVVAGMFGSMLRLPQAVQDVSPFTHVPAVPTDAVAVLPLVVLSAIALAGFACAAIGFRRRDVPAQ